MTRLRARNVSLRAGGRALVDGVSLDIEPGSLTAILGPNGAGKTTLLRIMVGLYAPDEGVAELDGDAVFGLSPTVRAQKVSYLPQRRPLAWPNRVCDIVALGRFAHGAALGRLGPADAAAVDAAIVACDLAELRERSVDTLSGGELARVHFARAIAAAAPLLVADEPVAALDPRHHIRIAELLRSFVDEGGGALVVLHDVPLAVRYADRLVWMRDGRILADGSTEETLTEAIMHEVYGVRARVERGDEGLNVIIDGVA